MSWSLQLRNGDLVVDKGRLGFVTGSAKLVQDLRCALLERMGSDDLHPEFGALLDGGTMTDGTEVASIIGETDPDLIQSFVTTEINRVIRDHQAKQLVRAQSDRLRYNKTTLTFGEIIENAQVNMGMLGDTLVVQIVLTSSSGDQKTIAIPFNT